jgi:hypothetical protein
VPSDFAGIGRVPADGGGLGLSTCRTIAGQAGQAFVAALSRAAGIAVAAATSLSMQPRAREARISIRGAPHIAAATPLTTKLC